VNIVYSDGYRIDLGLHVFPTEKYRLVLMRLLEKGLVKPEAVLEPSPACWEDLALVHTAPYLEKAREGRFTPPELARLELPWSPAIMEGFRLIVGGTVAAARRAVSSVSPGWSGSGARCAARLRGAVQLGGGFHHAFPDHGEGFCLFNDIAVAIRRLQADDLITRAAVVDCDVHHGNGTAGIFSGDPSVYTLSVHQEHNYPIHKPPGSRDVGLPDGARDEEYLEALEAALPDLFAFQPDIVFYLAGADPFEGDQLGGLNVSAEGLRLRDFLVLRSACTSGVPVVVTLAGGYARRLEDTVAIHAATVTEALKLSSSSKAQG
jgi:acetoin utilization deacetylase AcuC-like enzyme